MAKITQKIEKFNVGMTPDFFGNGIYRMEHFDTVTPQARPVRELVATTVQGETMRRLTKYCRGTNNRLYALGANTSNGNIAIAKWDYSNYRWDVFFNNTSTAQGAEIIFFFNGHLYGLRAGTHIWKQEVTSETAGSFTATHASLTYTTASDPIVHSKDGVCYIPVDNKLYTFDGTSATLVLTFPTNFIVTSISEQGDYINIIGYDSQRNIGTSFLWDRDSSLATLTGKYDLGQERPTHNGNIGGTEFIISAKQVSGNVNASWASYPSLVIRYINGDKAIVVNEYKFQLLTLGGKYVDNNGIYFNAYVKFLGESSAHYLTFRVDEQGKLTAILNVGINDSGSRSDLPGIFNDGELFFVGGGADGCWETTSTYGTTSIIETTKVRSSKLENNIDLIGAVVTFEALPAAGQVLVKTRKDEEVSWTTIGTFTTDNAIKGSMNNILVQGQTAKDRQFRIESTGGAVITGFQADFDEKQDEIYG